MISIRGRPVSVDIRAELDRFQFVRPRWTSDKLIAASPFRYDTHPSWFVSLEHGGWHDSGAVDDNFRSGNFVSLIAFLDGITYDEAADYLIAMYTEFSEHSAISLVVPKLLYEDSRIDTTMDERKLAPYQYRHPYLGKRGISEGVQRLNGIGYDRARNAIVIPWRNPDGKLAAIKFRSTYSRVFWYERGGSPIRDLVYGIDIAYARKVKRAGIVEGETDAMTLTDNGLFTLATGGATNWNRTKADIIVRSPLEEIVIFRDNDAAGKAWARRIIEALAPHMTVKIATVPGRYKDVNEAAADGANISGMIKRAMAVCRIVAKLINRQTRNAGVK